MKRKGFCLLMALTLLASLVLPAFAEEAEEAEPMYKEITLSTAEDVQKLAKLCRLDSASRNLKVTLEKDISLSGYPDLEIPTFGGVFDGCGHRITDLNISAKGSVRGLFRYLQEGAVVQNLEVCARVLPQGSATQAGGLVGVNSGTIDSVRFSGTLAGTDRLGGIAGTNTVSGKIKNCTAEGYIRGKQILGGIVGENQGVVYNCVNRAEVNTGVPEEELKLDDITVPRLTSEETLRSGSDIGGVAGSSSGVIRLCRNEGNVGYPHTGYNVGGVAGSQNGFMADCVNYGDVYARKEGGGVLGQMEPNHMLEFSEDTLQKLQKELRATNGILTQTSSDASAANSSVQSSLVHVQNNMGDFLSAINYLLETVRSNTSITLPDTVEGDIPIPDLEISNQDQVWAAAGLVGECLTDVVNSVSNTTDIATNEGGVVLADLQALANQLNRVVNVMSGREEDASTVEDVSGQNVQEDSPGKIRSCINYGTVNADINSGGIVGALSWENDLDPEDDLKVQGDVSLNFTYKTRALVYQCMNRGTVQAKKQACGGVAGRSSLGAIIECEGYGLVKAEDASWVGGIVGKSEAEVRGCWAKCSVTGGNLCGGVAGEAAELNGCRALVTVENGGEYTGAIAGKLSQDGTAERNVFVDSDTLAGIDGISYSGQAEPLNYRAFLELDGVPDAFRKMILTFVAEDRVITRRVDYDKTLKDIPEVPEKPGYSGAWEDFNAAHIRADQTVYAAYSELQASADSGESGGLPVVLAEGSFRDADQVTAEPLETDLPDTATAGWRITVPEDGAGAHVIHLRKPETDRHYQVLLDTGSGWQTVDAREDGSYLVFSARGNDFRAAMEPVSDNGSLWIAGAVGAGALVLLVGVLVYRRKKQKKTASKPVQ
ncbi:MAG: hypothetical protein J6B70_11110 [Oscillospiraceae bacterium]|nr:hypothetical protein [Oscillospiraceae bacterium]